MEINWLLSTYGWNIVLWGSLVLVVALALALQRKTRPLSEQGHT